MTDEELVERIYTGEETAFAEIYERYQSSIYRFAFHMTGSTSAGEDVTQEVFLILFQCQTYDPAKGAFAAYLFGIARHEVIRWIRKNKTYVPYSAKEHEKATPPKDLTHEQAIEAVRSSILTLPLRYREAVTLCDLHQKSYAEASQILKCAVGTVRSRLHRARSLLLKKLSKQNAFEKAKGALYELPVL